MQTAAPQPARARPGAGPTGRKVTTGHRAALAGMVLSGAVPVIGSASCPVETPLLPPQTILLPGRTTAVGAIDLDGDGHVDLVGAIRSDQMLAIVHGAANGAFTAPLFLAASEWPRAVALADVTGDGRPDIISAAESGGVIAIHANDGNRRYAPPVLLSVAAQPKDVTAADLNGDGRIDLAVVHMDHAGGPVSVLFNVHDGRGAGPQFAAPLTWPVQSGARSIGAADFDGDGHIDLHVTNRDARSLSLLRNDGSGGFVITHRPTGLGTGPRDSVAVDLDGDGLLDLAVADFQSGNLLVLSNLGHQDGAWYGFGAIETIPGCGLGPHGIDAADLTGSGAMDLVMVNVNSNSFCLFENDGRGGFTVCTVSAPGSVADVVVIDVDADGRPDVLTANGTLGMGMSVFLQAGPAPVPCPGDADDSGAVDFVDVLLVLAAWGESLPTSNLSGGSTIGYADLLIVLSNFGTSCGR